MTSSESIIRLLLTLVLLVSATGCDDNTIISPFSGRDAHFSIYGFISTSDTQLVRIVPVRNRLERDDQPTDLQAVVTTTELNSGRVDIWSPVRRQLETGDLGLQFSDSTFGHVYRAIFTPNSGDAFEMRIEGFDGNFSSATTSIPFVSQPVLGDYFDVDGEIHQRIVWPGVFQQPFRVATWLYFASTNLRPDEFAVPFYHNAFGEVTEDGLTIELNLNEDIRLLRRHIVENLSRYSDSPTVENPSTFPLVLTDRRIRIFVGDSTWAFISSSPDEARSSQPGALSNVHNGFGFFGSLGTSVVEAPIIDPAVRLQIGLSS
ncbi:MAG: hypothetical protein HKN43_15150 [Rhodothermales bacterium]|nr:hypothetical protein [Rhodothermales bacterium]